MKWELVSNIFQHVNRPQFLSFKAYDTQVKFKLCPAGWANDNVWVDCILEQPLVDGGLSYYIYTVPWFKMGSKLNLNNSTNLTDLRTFEVKFTHKKKTVCSRLFSFIFPLCVCVWVDSISVCMHACAWTPSCVTICANYFIIDWWIFFFFPSAITATVSTT